MKKLFLDGIVGVIISISIIVGCYLIADAIKTNANNKTTITYDDLKVLNLKQVAEYLNMTEENVMSIIEIEETDLITTGSFTGVMFPYFTVDDNLYFYKDGIDAWVEDATIDHRYYDTVKGFLLR